MYLNLIAFVLVLAITFMHSIFGFYSGLINLFCTLIAAALALGFWETATDVVSGSLGTHAGYTGPCMIIAIFVTSLALLRTAADNLIRGNIHLPQWLDWGGAGVCGFVIAQVTVGIMVISVTSLPLGGSVLSYERYTRIEGESDPDRSQVVYYSRNPLWLRSVDMTVGLFNLMSSGSLRGQTEFVSVYPDFGDAIWFSSNTVEAGSNPAPYREKRADGFKQGLGVQEWEWVDVIRDVRYRKDAPTARVKNPPFENIGDLKPRPGHRFMRVRAELREGAADRRNRSPIHHYRPTMLRLVGDAEVYGEKRPQQYVPLVLGGADQQVGGANRLVDPESNISQADATATIDAFFEVDETFTPRFLEYRRHARAGVTGEPVESGQSVALRVETAEQRREREERDSLTFRTIASQRSGAKSGLPDDFTLSGMRRAGSDLELSGKLVQRGRIYGTLTALKEGSDKSEGFLIPEGKRMVQIAWAPNEARTLAGQVLNFVGQVNQYYCEDDRGDSHALAGYMARVKRGNQVFFEIFYHGDPAEPGYNHMLDFKHIERQELFNATDDEAEVTLLFLVPPGVTVTRLKDQAGRGEEVSIRVSP